MGIGLARDVGKCLEIYLCGILKICEVGFWVGNLNEAFTKAFICGGVKGGFGGKCGGRLGGNLSRSLNIERRGLMGKLVKIGLRGILPHPQITFKTPYYRPRPTT